MLPKGHPSSSTWRSLVVPNERPDAPNASTVRGPLPEAKARAEAEAKAQEEARAKLLGPDGRPLGGLPMRWRVQHCQQGL